MDNDRAEVDCFFHNGLVDALFEGNTNILVLTDSRMAVLRVNQNASAFFGVPEEAMVGCGLETVFNREQCGRIREIAARLKIDSETTTVCFDLADYSGGRRQQEIVIRCICIPLTGFRGYLFIIQREQRSSSKYPVSIMRLLKGQSASVIIIDAPSCLVLDCNRVAERMFGYSRGEIIGRSPRFLAPSPHLANEYITKSKDCCSRNGFYQELIQCRRKDGSLFMTLTTVISACDSEDIDRYTVVINRDHSSVEKNYDDIIRIAEQSEKLALALKEAVYPLKRSEPRSTLRELGFTVRQIEIAVILVTGETTKAIAKELNVSEATVKNNLSAMYRMLGVSSRMEFLRFITERQIRIE